MPHRPADDVDLVPAADPVGARQEDARYEHDFYSWTQEQARLVREGRWDGVDRQNLAEEVEDLGREQFAKLESALRVILMHMLKWDHQPERRGRSWALSIKVQRIDLDDVLDGNPGLKPRIPEAVARAYRKARLIAAQETAMSELTFPEQCPYSWDDIVGREFPS